ncbi:putative ATP-dependent protease [Rhodovulum bhavnagarense]|uniref:endopeptidase La n=1 Tax=Rhodovulum bhavnagarense TaxID=992286 RepID=A0A4R2RKX2_9RHOB|nr:ATP-binding protein [Rhodovulum bhavnagarense]TCP60371.1 putative ATP-dependent protease [Rhodovulum bhavnagarense]
MDEIATGQPIEPARLRPGAAFALDFESTDTLIPLEDWPGQDRALEAMRLAASTPHEGFNLFVLGPPGSGRHSATHKLLAETAVTRPAPEDWAYVGNFDDPRRPVALALPPGRANALRDGVRKVINDLANDIPAIFESEDYQARRRAIEETYEERHEAAMSALADTAREKGVAIVRTPMGFGVAPRKDDDILPPDEYEKLSDEARAALDAAVGEVREQLEAILQEVPKGMKAQRREVEEMNIAMARDGVESAMAGLLAEFADHEGALRHLQAMRDDLIDNAELFLIREDGPQAGAFPVATAKHYQRPQFSRYAVNVIVSRHEDATAGAPVVEESLPTLANLIGRIEYQAEHGALVTNFTMIRAGALHRANGGFLILDAAQVLTEPLAWDALKRSLKSGEIKIFSAGERFSLISTETLEPDPIPLRLRVVLVGDRMLYYLLVALDPDFSRLFKLEADFDDRMPRSAASALLFARLIARMVQTSGLRAVSAGGVERLLEESLRLSDDAERFSLNLAALADILHEAEHRAGENGAARIGADEIAATIEAAERRAGRLRDLSQEMIARGTLLIDTDGARIGQINALSVLEIGKSRFGRPTRVSARVRMGAGKVVDIEREAELGGPIHSKGVMILSGYLGGTYVPDLPMSLWASLVFEQSYGGIEGDSASAAELLALLSALAEVAIDQSYAVTGSVNQFGDIQPIGGVNEKIEGFFDICAARGLTGRQGVLIPATNLGHLVLRPRVIEAVEAGAFRIIPMAHVDEGLAILTGHEAGARGKDGTFAPDSINAKVEARLTAFAEARRHFGNRGKHEENTP